LITRRQADRWRTRQAGVAVSGLSAFGNALLGIADGTVRHLAARMNGAGSGLATTFGPGQPPSKGAGSAMLLQPVGTGIEDGT
jgi:hypothetical protein